MKKEKALLIVNPQAGQKKAQINLFGVVSALSSRYLVTVHPTVSGEDAIYTARDLVNDYDVVFCCGGDGTLSQVINGCANVDVPPTIGYIPCGTANDVAATLGLPKNMALCAKKLVSAKANSHDIGVFCGDKKFVYIASFGAFTKSSYDTPQAAKNAFGQAAYVFTGMSDLVNVKKIATIINCDGKEYYFDDIAFLAISNTRSTGGIIKFPKNQVSLCDGKFELLIVRYPTDMNMVNDIWTAISMQSFDANGENVKLLHGSRFEIRTKESVAWTLDGENAGELSRVSVECIKNSVKILY